MNFSDVLDHAKRCDLRAKDTFPFVNFTPAEKNFMSRRLYYSGCIAFIAFLFTRTVEIALSLSFIIKNNVGFFFFFDTEPQTRGIEKFEKLKHNSRMMSYFFIYEMYMMKTGTFRALDATHSFIQLIRIVAKMM